MPRVLSTSPKAKQIGIIFDTQVKSVLFLTIGRDCSVIPTCFKVSNCTGNGLCVDFDVCKCNVGWTGTNCTQYSCERWDYCSGNIA